MRGAPMDIDGGRTGPPRRMTQQQELVQKLYGRDEQDELHRSPGNMKRLFRQPASPSRNAMMLSTPSVGMMSTYSTNTKRMEWICTVCSYVNADGRSKVCSICGCKRDGVASGTGRYSPSSTRTTHAMVAASRGKPSPTSSPAHMQKQNRRPPQSHTKPPPEIQFSSSSSSSSTKEKRRGLRNEFLNGEDSDSSKEEIVNVTRSHPAGPRSRENNKSSASLESCHAALHGSQKLDESSDSMGFLDRERLRPGMPPRSTGGRMSSFNEEDESASEEEQDKTGRPPPRRTVKASDSLGSQSSFIRPTLTRKDNVIQGVRTTPGAFSVPSPGAPLPQDDPEVALSRSSPLRRLPVAALPQQPRESLGSVPQTLLPSSPPANRQTQLEEEDPADRIAAMMRSLEAGEGLPPQPESWAPQQQRSPPAESQNRRDRYAANTGGDRGTKGGTKLATEMSFARWTDDDTQAWECKVCTYMNENALHLTCQICGNRRGSVSLPNNHQSPSSHSDNTAIGGAGHESSAGGTMEGPNNNHWSPTIFDAEEEAFQKIRRERIEELIRMQRELLEDCQKSNTNINDSSSSSSSSGRDGSSGGASNGADSNGDGGSSNDKRTARLRRLNQVSSNLSALVNLHTQEVQRRESLQGEQRRRRSIIVREEGPNAFNAMEPTPPTDGETRSRRQNFAATPAQLSTQALEWLGTQRRIDEWGRELEDRRFRLDKLRDEQERLWELYTKKLQT